MVGKSFISFAGDVKLFERFTNPAVWKGNLDKEIRRATLRSALFLVKQVKANIRNGEFTENAPMTLALKRSNKALIDNRNLFKAIDHALKNSFEAEIGILRNAGSTGSKFGKAKSQINIKDLVELMEEGYTITVTQKMRQAIAASLNADKGKSGKIKKKSRVALDRLGQIFGGKTYVIPPRKILSKVFEDPATERVIRENWRRALGATFKAQGAK